MAANPILPMARCSGRQAPAAPARRSLSPLAEAKAAVLRQFVRSHGPVVLDESLTRRLKCQYGLRSCDLHEGLETLAGRGEVCLSVVGGVLRIAAADPDRGQDPGEVA